MDFERSPFGKMQLWIVEHFHLHKKVPVLMNHNIRKKLYVMIHYYRYLFVKMKVFNYSELHFSEGTSFKIHTLKWTVWRNRDTCRTILSIYFLWKKYTRTETNQDFGTNKIHFIFKKRGSGYLGRRGLFLS